MTNFIKSLALLLLWALTTNLLIAQDIRDTEIRRLENVEREAVMRGDSTLLFNTLWSPKMVINTPANRVGTVDETKMQLRTGKLNYLSFERNIEKITFNDNLAIGQTNNHRVFLFVHGAWGVAGNIKKLIPF